MLRVTEKCSHAIHTSLVEFPQVGFISAVVSSAFETACACLQAARAAAQTDKDCPGQRCFISILIYFWFSPLVVFHLLKSALYAIVRRTRRG